MMESDTPRDVRHEELTHKIATLEAMIERSAPSGIEEEDNNEPAPMDKGRLTVSDDCLATQ